MTNNQETRSLISIGLVVLLVLVLLPALLMPLMMGGMMAGGMMGWWGPYANAWAGSGWWGLGMVLFWIVFIGGIALLIGWALRRSISTSASGGDVRKHALNTLKERYARGEIDKEQYEQIKSDLMAS